jgi:hypothetical protein
VCVCLSIKPVCVCECVCVCVLAFHPGPHPSTCHSHGPRLQLRAPSPYPQLALVVATPAHDSAARCHSACVGCLIFPRVDHGDGREAWKEVGDERGVRLGAVRVTTA